MSKESQTTQGITFLGHPPDYWMELQSRADKLAVGHLIQELADAHGKIGFYEQRIREMNQVMEKPK